MSAKQLAKTVVDGRRINLDVQGGRSVSGYLCGMDDFHWMIVTPEGVKHLVHKGSASVVTLSDAETYEGEPNHAALETVVRPFRAWVARTFFSREER